MTDLQSAPTPTHDEIIADITGGMLPAVEPFAGSERLRPDGRPRPELRSELRRIADVKNAFSIVGAFGAPVAVVALVAMIDRWWAVVPAIIVMASLQNRIAILHHEGAHRLLFSNRRINDLIGVNLCGWAVFGNGTHAYRRGHGNHHRDEFGPKEPDLVLYAFYPIRRESLRRKLRRDATGVSAYRRHRGDLTGLFVQGRRIKSARFLLGVVVILAAFVFAGVPWLWLWLWLVPYVFVVQVLNRLRSIAEHGGLTRSSDRRLTTHHVRQSLVARAMFVPIGVGYHLAHHVDSGIPFRNLARFQQILEEDGYITPDITWPNYRALWKAQAAG